MLNSIATRLFLVVASIIVFLCAPVEAKTDDVLLAKLFQHGLWGLFANETALTHPGPDKGRRYPMYRAFHFNETFSGEGKEMNATFFLPRKPIILLIGDSVDRLLMRSNPGCSPRDYFKRTKDLCNATTGRVTHYDKERRDSFVCSGSNMVLANLFLRGILNGTHQNAVCELGMPLGLNATINHAAASFISRRGSPDLVLFKSFYWDLLGLSLRAKERREPLTSLLSVSSLEDIYRLYALHLEASLSAIKMAFPSAVVALRNDPLWDQRTQRFGDPALIHTIGLGLLKTLRHVAAKNNEVLFDFYSMFEPLEPTTYLNDDIHVCEYFSRIILQILYSFLAKRVQM